MDLEDLRVDFNAVLTSGGGSLTERQFMSDFKSLIGKEIPFRTLGHNNLLSLLKALGGFSFAKRGSENVIFGQCDEKTAHIASLISRQRKKPGKVKPKARRSFVSLSYSRRPPPPLMHVEVRRPPVVNRGQREPPPPRFGNPPIIPQRQPLTAAQSRLDAECPRQLRLNVPETRKSIINDESNSNNDNSNAKVPQFVEEDQPNFIDIQWLQAKIKNTPAIQDNCTSPSLVAQPATSSSRSTEASGPEQTVLFKCHVDELSTLASRLGLPKPSFTDKKRTPLRARPVYMSTVKVGDMTFNSFPEEKPTPQEAQECVAELACKELRAQLSKLKTEEKVIFDHVLIERVYEIVKEKENGFMDYAVVTAYEDCYGSSICASWLDVIMKSPKFSVEKINDKKSIIYPVFKEVSQDSTRSDSPDGLDAVQVNVVPGSTLDSSVSITETSTRPAIAPKCNGVVSSANRRLSKDVNANTVMVTDKPRILPQLVLPTANTWDVFVASVGTEDIWVRLIGEDYDVKYNDVMTDLELELSTHDEVVTNPQIDDYYCIKCDSCFIRVQLKEMVSEEECEVFLVDNGETDTVSLSDLRVLPTDYTKLPAQAIQCRLSYLDISYEAAQTYLMNHVIGSSFVAEVVKMPNETSLANIILHNTNSEDEKLGSINVNHCILEEIIKKLEPPTLTQRHLGFLRLTHVEVGSSPYCQVESKDLTFLETLLKEIHDNMDVIDLHGLNAHPRMACGGQNKKYLCKFNNTWRRGTILNTDDSRNPTVFFIDNGQKEKVTLRDIFDLEKVYPPLTNFPAQAIQVNLLDLPPSKLNVGVINRLVELAPPNMFVISKCTNFVGGLPEVELFKRVDGMIASINTDLTFNYEEYSQRTEPQKPSSLLLNGTPGCTKPLDKYPLPSVDSDYFDVSISMSSSPFNFVVQPLKNRLAFDNMMQELQEVYEAQHSVMPSPAIEELTENATFVVKHPEDLMWYRVSIVTASDSLVSVRYLDWGDVGLVPIEDMRYLEERFRAIPSLAIRAKLHGVKPKDNSEWTVSQCLHFNELVDSKSFVSRVMDVNSASNSNSWELSLCLIDTTAVDLDVNISELLVSRGIADVGQ